MTTAIAPKYVATHWQVGDFRPYPGGPLVTPQSIYVSDQSTLDLIVQAAVQAGITLRITDDPPEGSTPTSSADFVPLPPPGTPAGSIPESTSDGGIVYDEFVTIDGGGPNDGTGA